MRTDGRADYRAVLHNREYVGLLLSQALSMLGDQMSRIALALLVFSRTGSPFAASATYALSYGAYLVGGPLLSTLADRYPRRSVMVISDSLRLLLVAGLVLEPPVPVIFVLIALLGAAAPAFTSARSAVLPDVLGEADYPTGLGLVNSVTQASQFLGFGLGGAVVALSGTRVALLVDASTFAVSALTVRLLLTHRRAASTQRTGFLRESLLGLSTVWQSVQLRRWLSWGLLLSVAAAAPEGLAVAVSSSHGGGALQAGLLTAALPLGFVLGTFVVLRLPPARRVRLLPAFAALSFAPLLLTAVTGSLDLILALWLVSGAGGAGQVAANAEYARQCPTAVRGRAFGLAGTALMAWQGVVVLAAGAAAGALAPTTVIGFCGVLGLFAALLLARASHLTLVPGNRGLSGPVLVDGGPS